MAAIIRYTIVSSTLGRVLVGATLRGVCALALDESDVALERFLREECPTADLVRDDATLAGWADAVVGGIDGTASTLDVPIDARGTQFQQRVWQELCKIPFGRTSTYAQIAQALGRPTATRAVARACATNPVSILVPCHRVVRTDGNLAGYRWGIERKRAILQREAQS